MVKKQFDLVENYIYIYQLDKYCIIPTYPEQLIDTLGSTFAQTNALARTSPIYSYSYSGPRTVQITLQLHLTCLYGVEVLFAQFILLLWTKNCANNTSTP